MSIPPPTKIPRSAPELCPINVSISIINLVETLVTLLSTTQSTDWTTGASHASHLGCPSAYTIGYTT